MQMIILYLLNYRFIIYKISQILIYMKVCNKELPEL